MRSLLYRISAIVFVSAWLMCPKVLAAPTPENLQRHLRDRVIANAISPNPTFSDRLSTDGHDLWRFYAARNFSPMWFDRYGLTKKWGVFRRAAGGAALDGLSPDDYTDEELNKRIAAALVNRASHKQPDYIELSRLELLMTDRLLLYASHLAAGRTDPAITDPDWHIDGGPSVMDRLPALLTEEQPLVRVFDRLKPRHPLFESLQGALRRYYRIQEAGGWPAVPPGPLLRPGDRDARVGLLRSRLSRSGDWKGAPPADPDQFDAGLEAAVLRFQERHGLLPDGLVGTETLTALNVPVETRIQQIRMNMERLRWLPRDLGAQHLFVNVTEYRLNVVEADRIAGTHPVIVGRKDRPTPSLSGQMTHLMLNPYWIVPPRIAKEDILPKIQHAPDYLAEKKIRVFADWSKDAPEIDPASVDWTQITPEDFQFKLRQDPAETNALGRIKFVFPNPFDIFIHDTHARNLFQEPRRNFSSGCIRIERPLELARFLIRNNPRWTADALHEALSSRQRTIVFLSEPVPVYILYLTAWAAADGTIHFREDIYERDQRLYAAFTPAVFPRHAMRSRLVSPSPDPFPAGRFSPRPAAGHMAPLASGPVSPVSGLRPPARTLFPSVGMVSIGFGHGRPAVNRRLRLMTILP